MKPEKFITVMAVLDDDTQQRLQQMQDRLLREIGPGTQTMGIPFHITLGSYPPDDTERIVETIRTVAEQTVPFAVAFKRFHDFGNRVLYLEPDISVDLVQLRRHFASDYAGGFDWVPHTTLFCGEEDQVIRAKEWLGELAVTITAQIVGIELGEFFPVKKMIRVMF